MAGKTPTCELRGHFAGGHCLSALALAGASGNSDLQHKGHGLVAELAQCQKQIGTGYLSAYPAELFERLAKGKSGLGALLYLSQDHGRPARHAFAGR